jgi:hypothetical protein
MISYVPVFTNRIQDEIVVRRSKTKLPASGRYGPLSGTVTPEKMHHQGNQSNQQEQMNGSPRDMKSGPGEKPDDEKKEK